MAHNSKIEWCHHTDNLWWGCVGVHRGCNNCYAEAVAGHYGFDVWGNDKPRRAVKGVWSDFLTQQAKAAAAGEFHRVFVGSMMDIFEKPFPLIDHTGHELNFDTGDLREKFFSEIVPNCPNLIFLLLTKRPSNINKFIPESWKVNPPDNVMFGTSPVDWVTFEHLTRQLKQVNGKRFLSIEPQLELINPDCNDLNGIDWVIQGGESGHNRRPFNTDWGRIMRDRCDLCSVPYFFKQVDKVQPIPSDLMIRQFPK